MPEISRFFGLIIRMYFDDHGPPHFHGSYADPVPWRSRWNGLVCIRQSCSKTGVWRAWGGRWSRSHRWSDACTQG